MIVSDIFIFVAVVHLCCSSSSSSSSRHVNLKTRKSLVPSIYIHLKLVHIKQKSRVKSEKCHL